MTSVEKIKIKRKVKGLMELRGIEVKNIAKKLKVAPNTIYVVRGGHWPSKRIKKAIADALGMKVEELWSARCHIEISFPDKNGEAA